MRAMASEYEVVGVQGVGHANGRCLLPCGKVGRPRVIVRHSIVAASSLHEVEHGLELTDVAHVAIYAQKIFFCEIAFF